MPGPIKLNALRIHIKTSYQIIDDCYKTCYIVFAGLEAVNIIAKYEKRKYDGDELVWVGKYKNLHNISHWHTEHEIIACQSGITRIFIDNKSFAVHEGQCIFCPAGSVHHVDADPDCVLLVCIFDRGLTKSVTKGSCLKVPIFDDKYGTLAALDGIFREMQAKRPFYVFRVNAMITTLVIDIYREEQLAENGNENLMALTRYKELLNWIDKNYEFISFSDAANFMNLSETYFSRYFKKMSGTTFSKYLNYVKVERAVGLMSAERDIPKTSLMLQCGFNTIRSFNRAFKEYTGYSPQKLPNGFSLNVRPITTTQEICDPTLDNSILL